MSRAAAMIDSAVDGDQPIDVGKKWISQPAASSSTIWRWSNSPPFFFLSIFLIQIISTERIAGQCYSLNRDPARSSYSTVQVPYQVSVLSTVAVRS